MDTRFKGSFVILSVLIGLAAPSIAFGQNDGIDGRCKEKWSDKYKMQQHCREQQADAKRWVNRFDENYDGSTRMTILKNCKKKWSDSHGHNWQMVKHCVEQQVEAAQELQESNGSKNSSSKIAKRCRQKWNDNFQMQEHCRDQQSDAKDWVTNEFTGSNDSSSKRRLVSQCKRKWDDGPGYNWQMVKHCIEQQL